MGLDAPSLENYGGFERLLERLKTRQKLSDILGSADQDFAMIMHEILVHGADPYEAVLKVVGGNDKLINEFVDGINAMTKKDRKDLSKLLKNMLGN